MRTIWYSEKFWSWTAVEDKTQINTTCFKLTRPTLHLIGAHVNATIWIVTKTHKISYYNHGRLQVRQHAGFCVQSAAQMHLKAKLLPSCKLVYLATLCTSFRLLSKWLSSRCFSSPSLHMVSPTLPSLPPSPPSLTFCDTLTEIRNRYILLSSLCRPSPHH